MICHDARPTPCLKLPSVCSLEGSKRRLNSGDQIRRRRRHEKWCLPSAGFANSSGHRGGEVYFRIAKQFSIAARQLRISTPFNYFRSRTLLAAAPLLKVRASDFPRIKSSFRAHHLLVTREIQHIVNQHGHALARGVRLEVVRADRVCPNNLPAALTKARYRRVLASRGDRIKKASSSLLSCQLFLALLDSCSNSSWPAAKPVRS